MIDSFSGGYIHIINKSGFDFCTCLYTKDRYYTYNNLFIFYILSLQNWILPSKYASYCPLCDLVYIGFAF